MNAKRLCVLLLIIVSQLAGCSKDAPQQQVGKGLVDSSILNTLPESTVGFYVWNTGNDGYKKWRESGWGKQDLVSQLSQVQSYAKLEQSKETIDAFTNALKQSGLIADGDKVSGVEQGVLVLEAKPGTQIPRAAVAFIGKEDLEQKLPAFESAFVASGRTPEKEDFNGKVGFSVKFPEDVEVEGVPAPTAYFVAAGNRIAASSDKELAQALIGSGDSATIAKIKDSDQFKQTIAALSVKGEQFGFGYLDFEKFISNYTPQGSQENNAKMVPVKSVAFSRSMADGLVDVAAIRVEAKDETQTKVFEALQSASSSNGLLKQVPADTLLMLSFNAAFIGNLADTLKENPAAQSPEIERYLGVLRTIKDVGIGVRKASAGSPFPEILILGLSSDVATLRPAVKEMLTEAVASIGMPGAEFQTKEVDGNQIEYVMSPFGVGLYLGQTADGLVISSTESGLKDCLTSASGKGSSLIAGIPGDGRKLAEAGGVILAYTDFQSFADMMESVRGSLAMFTGGAGQPDTMTEDLASLRSMGSMMVAVNYNNGTLKIESNYSAPRTAG